MSKIKILVACHKPTDVYHDEVYTPIHVGRAISSCSKDMEWMIGDNTGDNISELNPFFCELTAQYWAWKNLHDVEYVGFCHYRRFLKEKFTSDNIDFLINGYDAIVGNKYRLKTNILEWWNAQHTPEDVAVFYLYMNKRFPEYKEQFSKFFEYRNWINPCNMFVCKKEDFDKFCEWQFSILNDLFKIIPQSPHARLKRLMGYFAESLFPFYMYLNGKKVKEMGMIERIGSNETVFDYPLLRNLRFDLTFFCSRNKSYRIHPATEVSLKQDGLVEKIEEVVQSKICNKQ